MCRNTLKPGCAPRLGLAHPRGPTPGRDHPCARPCVEPRHARVPGRPRRDARLLQRGGGGAPRRGLRGGGPDAGPGMGNALRAGGQRRPPPRARGAAAVDRAEPRARGTSRDADPLGLGRGPHDRGDRVPGRRPRGPQWRDRDLLERCDLMLVRAWGARGSLPTPGADMVRYGGNTSCVQVTLSDGTEVILDAGTGIRNLPADLGADGGHIHILLSHLHLDHIQGLLFFEPLFHAESEVTIWGPSAPHRSLQSRIGRYLSAPLTPLDIRELSCQLDFRNLPVTHWDSGPARIRAETVTHRGPTLGFRIED